MRECGVLDAVRGQREPGAQVIFWAMSESADPRDELLLALSPGERFLKALSLSAFVRELAWQGARLVAEADGPEAVVDRFVRQLYGDEVAEQFRARRSATHRQ